RRSIATSNSSRLLKKRNLRSCPCDRALRDSLLLSQFLGPDISERQIGCRVVPLKLQRAGFGAEAVAGVFVRFAIVGPVGDLIAVDPDGNVRPIGDDGLV